MLSHGQVPLVTVRGQHGAARTGLTVFPKSRVFRFARPGRAKNTLAFHLKMHKFSHVF
jgi:hypothetical protein